MNYRAITAVAGVALTLAGCSNTTTTATTTTRTVTSTAVSTTTIAATPTTMTTSSQPALQSKIIDLELPPGTLSENDPKYPDIELWDTTLSKQALTEYLNDRLPLGKPAKGIPWCSRSERHWDWSDGKNFITVHIMSDGKLSISRGDSELDRQGCAPIP